jgi:hypothetical protein
MKNKNLNKKLSSLVIILSLVVCLGNAFADGNEALQVTLPLFTGKYDVGVVSLGSFGLRGEATALMKIPENAEIIAGYLYLSGYSNLAADQLEDIHAVLSNADSVKMNVTAQLIGRSAESASLCFTYRAEVTEAIVLGENRFKVENVTLPSTRPTQGRIYGGGLVVIYSLPKLPEANIWIADGLDYFSATAGYPNSGTVVLPFSGNRFERYGWVKIFAGVDDRSSAAAIWCQTGSGAQPTESIVNANAATDFNHSSASNPAENTEPLTTGLGVRQRWTMVEFSMDVQSEQEWAAFALESETDQAPKPAFSGVWNMIAFKLPFEETGCGSLGDRVFYDKNSNGVRDQMEPGIPGVRVSLFKDNSDGQLDPASDTLVDSVRTNRLGFYLFQNLEFGTYFVGIDHPKLADTSVVLTAQTNPSAAIVIESCAPMLDLDFGLLLKNRQPYNPTRIRTFAATRSRGGINLNWTADANSENFGFDLYRSDREAGDYQLVNPEVIQPSATASDLHEYAFEDTQVEAGQTYFYQLADVGIEGNTTFYGPVDATTSASGVGKAGKNAAQDYQLTAAYPNPFNGSAMIQYHLPQTGFVRIELFNLLGQKVRTLLAANQTSGSHQLQWNANDDYGQVVSSGVYFIQMIVNDFKTQQRILYLK